MWIFLSNSFLSIVAKPGTAGAIMIVRARAKGDIERVFPKAKVRNTTRTRKNKKEMYDYGFRTEVPVEDVAVRISDMIHEITYENFKSSVKEEDRHLAYLKVWGAMARWQDDLTYGGFQ